MSSPLALHEVICQTVLRWEGVTSRPHRFGGIEFRSGRKEFGHLHGDVLLDIPFPRDVRDELIAAGRVEPHHVLPQSGWVSFVLKGPEDIQEAILLLRRSYELSSQIKR